jgi:hypothetical protein
MSDCGRMMQLGVLAEVLVARILDAQHDDRLGVPRDVERVHHPDLHAGDLDVFPAITKPALSKIARTR